MTVRSTTTDRPDIMLANPLFISKDPVEQKLMTPYFPLGLLYLASVLRQNDYSVAMFDGTFEPDYDSFERAMQQYKPKIVGLTALITTRNNALKLAEIAKRHGATVIFGGPDPTGKPEAYLRHTNAEGQRVVDIVVWDEGEVTIIELMNHLTGRNGADLMSIKQIKGLRFLNEHGEVDRHCAAHRLTTWTRSPSPPAI
ncbi:MAG: cobalamin-dependent protein [Anaerolineae bacterium]